METLKDYILIEGEEIEKILEEWYSLPWYRRFFFHLKQFWIRNI